MRREKSVNVSMVMEINAEEIRGKGRSKKRRLNVIKSDTKSAGVCLCIDDGRDCVKWRFRTRVAYTKYLGFKRGRRNKLFPFYL